MSEILRVGISHGDYNGIGYEVILKALASEEMLGIATPVIFGSSELAAATINNCNLEGVHFTPVKSAADARDGRINVVDVCSANPHPVPGQPSREAGVAALEALEAACAALEEGSIDLLVTAPIDKNSIHGEGFDFPGHTEFLNSRFASSDIAGESGSLMVLFDDYLRVALVTTHLPIAEVASHITRESVGTAIRAFDATLRRDFACDRPLIAVLGLNPHCGDNGLIGHEEQDAIIPAIEDAKDQGILAFGPFPADGFFAAGSYRKFDGVLAMYHDQGLAPFKALARQGGVNFTAGLEIVRTSPDHGTAYEIAGKGVADEESMRKAIYKALDIYRARKNYEEMTASPLKIRKKNEK